MRGAVSGKVNLYRTEAVQASPLVWYVLNPNTVALNAVKNLLFRLAKKKQIPHEKPLGMTAKGYIWWAFWGKYA